MSYDIAIVASDSAATDLQAWSALDDLIEQQGDIPSAFKHFHDQIVARYPDIHTLSDDIADDGAWSSGPLLSGFGSAAAVISIRHSHADEVVPFVVAAARSRGLSVFDWTTRHVHRPDGLAGLELTVEDRFPHVAPTLQQALDAVRSLTPDGGPGFLILERSSSGYVQVAGGNGAFALEWRQTEGAGFKHYAAGLHGRDASAEIKIPTNGFHVTVQSNERLRLEDAERVLAAFASGDAKPAAFTWRDITSRFK